MRKILATAALATLSLGAVALPASAGAPVNASGTVSCNETGSIKFKPGLTIPGTGPATLATKLTFAGCTGTGDGATIASGGGKGAASMSGNGCTDLQTSPPVTITTIKWKGSKKLNTSVITNTHNESDLTGATLVLTNTGTITGSFAGSTFTEHVTTSSTVADLIAACGGKGLKGFTYSSGTFSIS